MVAADPWAPEQWRCDLYGLHWDGTEELLEPDIPVSGLEVTTTVSGTDTIKGTIKPEVPRLRGKVEPWATAVVAQFRGSILAMCIVDDEPIQDAGITFGSVGYFAYWAQMPYDGVWSKVQIDPLDAVREAFRNVQAHPFGNLGIVVDGTRSPVRIGTPAKDVNFGTADGDVSFESGPYVLAWYKTHDLANEVTTLAASTPFDFREVHTAVRDTIHHRLQLGYPRIGRRQHELRFHVGENVTAIPGVTYSGDEYASEVMMLGAGEGSEMQRAVVPTAYRPPAGRAWRRGRRVAVEDDKTLDTKAKTVAAAKAEAAWRSGGQDVQTITVKDHPNAPIGSWADGDDIFVTGDDLPWAGDLGVWVRVLSTTYKRDQERVDLSVVSTERTNRE